MTFYIEISKNRKFLVLYCNDTNVWLNTGTWTQTIARD